MDNASTCEQYFTSLQALKSAYQGASKGKRYRRYAVVFHYSLLENLLELQQELNGLSYRPRPHRRFIVQDPKKRLIDAPHFRDRIVHHAVSRVLQAKYEPIFIYDSYACRKFKGTHRALRRMQHFLRWKTDQPLYVLKIDVSKYYASVNHVVLKQLLRRKLTDRLLLCTLDTIIDSYQSGTDHDHLFTPDSPYHTQGPRGIPIGNLTSQVFANVYLHEVDVYAKRTLKIRRYVRYMDDIVIVSDDKRQLQEWQKDIITFLHDKLLLTVHPKKTRLFPARLGVDFVGYVIWPYKIRIRSSTLKNFKKRWRTMLKQYCNGDIEKEDLRATFYSWVAHVNHASPRQARALVLGLYSQYLAVRKPTDVYFK